MLFNCDCRLLIPHQKQVDVMCSDFPYGMGLQSNHSAVQFDKIVGDDEADYETLAKLIALADSDAYTFCRWDNLTEFPKAMKPKSFITWIKNNWGSGDLNVEYARMTESIAFWPKENHKWKKGRPVDVIYHDRVPSNALIHPSEKPTGVFGDLLDDVVCKTVYDPYCGAGACLVAAKERGLKAMGCEIVDDFCHKTASRLRQDFLL